MPQARTIIIAEAGVNHNGQIGLALKLVEAAHEAGADYVKFQTFRADRMISRRAPKAEYQSRLTGDQEGQLEMVRRLELSEADHVQILEHCRKCGIRFLSTGFDLESVDFLHRMGIDFFKLGSGEVTNLPLLRRVASLGRPVVLSTGMSTLDEVGQAVQALCQAGMPRHSLTLLHCNTEYPTPAEDVHLHALATLRDSFGVPVGYSDHTLGTTVAVAAVALGATIIEKHLTLDRQLPGPDHQASSEPAEFARLVKEIRIVERALGAREKVVSPSERKNVRVARRSLVAARAIGAGEKFVLADFVAKRPGDGISPMAIDTLVGRVSSRDYQEDDLIQEEI